TGYHPPGGQVVDDPWHVDRRMPLVVGSEAPLAGGLAAVIKLLRDTLPQFGNQRVDVLGRRGDPQHPAQQGDVTQVSRDRLGDAWVLDLDRDRPAVEGDGAVHLPDRCGGDGLRIPAGEGPFWRRAKF